jgi:predicted O-linked N-acetylglucosamine transferase (SPINDLY family)
VTDLIVLQQTLAARPHDPCAWLDVAAALLNDCQPQAALTLLQQAQTAGLDHPDLIALIISLKQMLADPIANELDQIHQLHVKKNFTAALEKAHALAQHAPDISSVWQTLADSYALLGLHESACDAIKHLVDICPHDAEAYSQLGDCYRQLQRDTEAEACYQQALRCNEACLSAYFQLGTLKHQQQLSYEAELYFRAILRYQPQHLKAQYNLGIVLENQQRHEDAAIIYRQILTHSPDHAATANNLGALLYRKHHYEEAELCLRQATQHNPQLTAAFFNLGCVLKNLNRHQEAEQSYRRVLQLEPTHSAAIQQLIPLLLHRQCDDEAEQLARTFIAHAPNEATGYGCLGDALTQQSKWSLAESAYQQAINLAPTTAHYHQALGTLYIKNRRLSAAYQAYETARQLDPDCALIYANLAEYFRRCRQLQQAIDSYRHAIALDQDNVDFWIRFGELLTDAKQFTEAEQWLRQALTVRPDCPKLYLYLANNAFQSGAIVTSEQLALQSFALDATFSQTLSFLGVVYQSLCQFDKSEQFFHAALSSRERYQIAFSNLLFTMNYHPDKSAEEIFAVYQDYDAQFGTPTPAIWFPYTNSKQLDRRLRIGYVSPDFCLHAAWHFIEPLLTNHNKDEVEIFAYAQLKKEDDVTKRLKQSIDHWRNTTEWTDEELIKHIRADQIDILVDLAGQTAGNRLAVFTHKPAPVTASWMGYGYTTGLQAIDYFLTDHIAAPNASDHLFAEKPWRLQQAAWVYRPDAQLPPINELPAVQNGYITLISLSRSVRLNDRVIAVWSQLLHRLPTARLIINSTHFRHQEMQEWLIERFKQQSIPAARLDIGYRSPPWPLFQQADLGLDCFPHNSGTTLFETLYMGLPFVTLAGRPSVGRLGAGILEGIGHPEWIAQNEDEYIEKVVALATDIDSLAQIRSQLRSQMEASPLMDEVGFTRQVENAYRAMFKHWACN